MIIFPCSSFNQVFHTELLSQLCAVQRYSTQEAELNSERNLQSYSEINTRTHPSDDKFRQQNKSKHFLKREKNRTKIYIQRQEQEYFYTGL